MRVSIVVPSFNQGRFIEETIRSCIEQDAVMLVQVLDGGSGDETRSILEKYSDRLNFWRSEPDRGQTATINEGLERAQGDLFGWQNSDDYYAPGALAAVIAAAEQNPEIHAYYGEVDYVDLAGKFIRKGVVREPRQEDLMPYPCVLNQALFVRMDFLREHGIRLDEKITHCMDYDFLWKLVLAGARFMRVEGFKAFFRQHDGGKSVYQIDRCYDEFFNYYARLRRDERVSLKSKRRLRQEMIANWKNDRRLGRWGAFARKSFALLWQ